jgi:hypothetical protein
MFEYKIGDITYRRYSKKYMTPEIFNAYKIYALTIMASFVSLVFVLGFYDLYVEHIAVDIVFAVSFILMATVIKHLYTNGILDRCVDYEGVAYNIASAYALFSQVSFWRTIVTLPFIIIRDGIDAITFTTSGIISIVLVVIAYMTTFGVFSKYKYHNRNAQKIFSAVIDGPIAMNEDCDEVLKQNMVTVHQLNHPEMADAEFFERQSEFYKSARNVKTVANDYDKTWRTYLACSNFQYADSIPDHTTLYENLNKASQQHKINVTALNKTVDKINKKQYVPSAKTSEQKTSKKTTFSRVRIEKVVEKKKETPVDEKPRKSLWDKDVNWY